MTEGKTQNMRIQLQIYPSYHVASLATTPTLFHQPSYLHILNSIQLIKFNTSITQSLKIGQSFYLYFHFTNQYLYYNQLQEELILTRNPQQRTAFKIISNKFDWSSRGFVQLSTVPKYQYRINLAESPNKYIRNLNGKLILSEVADDNSLFYIKGSIYGYTLCKAPIRLTKVEKNLKLTCKGTKQVLGQVNPTVSTSMFILRRQKCNSDVIGLQHVLSGKFINQIDGQFCTTKESEYISSYILRMKDYDVNKQLVSFHLVRNQQLLLTLPSQNSLCTLSNSKLQNVIRISKIEEQQIINIIPYGWLKAQRQEVKSKLVIQFILNECYQLICRLIQQHEEMIIRSLLNEGLLTQLQFTLEKYHDLQCLIIIRKIIYIILQIKAQFIIPLLKHPKLYIKVMNDEQYILQIIKIRILPKNQPQLINSIVKNVYNILKIDNNITLYKLYTLIVVSPIIAEYPQQCTILKEILENICKTIVTIQQKQITLFYLMALKVLSDQSSKAYFQTNIQPQLSLQPLEEAQYEEDAKIKLNSILMYIGIVFQQKQLDIPIISDKDNGPLSKTYKSSKLQPHIKTLGYFMDDILPKHCRFETYENKVISLCISRYYCQVQKDLTLIDCKEYIKNTVDNFNTYSYEDRQPYQFIQELTFSLKSFINKILALICENNLTYDSLTTSTHERTMKCVQQLNTMNISIQVMDKSLLWQFLLNKFNEVDKCLQIWINTLQTMDNIGNSYNIIHRMISTYRVLNDPSQQIQTIVSMFINNYHTNKVSVLVQYILKVFNQLSNEEVQIIINIIQENQLYPYLCDYRKNESVSQLLVLLMRVSLEKEESKLNGTLMLNTIVSYKHKWKYNDSEFNLMKGVLKCIGGIVSKHVYHIFSQYIHEYPIENYNINFLRLCQTFFTMNPQSLKKQFVRNFQYRANLLYKNKLNHILQLHEHQFLYIFIQLMLQFCKYHLSPDILYQLIGDQSLFSFLNKFNQENHMELKLTILNFMINSRARGGAVGLVQEDKFITVEDLQFLKQGTLFIRSQIQQIPTIKERELLLKEYTYIMIDFLKLREQLVCNSNNIPQNDLLTIQGTNKLLAFQLIDLIQITINTQQIKKSILDKILWLEMKFKVNINSVELTNIAVQVQEEVNNKEQFVFDYQLNESDSLREPSFFLINKVGLQFTLVYLLKMLSILSYRNSQQLCIPLNYLHYVITHYEANISNKQIQTLFIVFTSLVKHKQYRYLSKLQNILRKSLMVQGKISKEKQLTLQKCIIKLDEVFINYLHQILQDYETFSPFYLNSSAQSYFNKNGKHQVNWKITHYLSTLRFINILAKSLNFEFKNMFSQKEFNRKEFLGRLININKEHIKDINKHSSNTKLTIISYELQLINNLLRGPIQENIKTAIQFQYHQISSILKMEDNHEQINKENFTKVCIRIKKEAIQAILILAPFYQISQKEVLVIQQTIIEYYFRTYKIYGESELEKIIIDYTKQHKNQIKILYFDLSLTTFNCLVKIYEKTNNNIIRKLQTTYLQQARLKKSYSKKFKMLYQIYRVVADTFTWIGTKVYHCCKKTATQIDERMQLFQSQEETHTQCLNQTFEYFVKNVANVEVQVKDKTQTIYFLLLKQARCYNTSIRKEMHRRVGLGQRQFRLKKFVQVSKYIILRLQIEKSIKKWTQKYRPIDIIISNRQLWKSSNFLCALLLNFFFLEDKIISNVEVPVFILRGLSYIFCILLFMIYFIQNLPLKRRIAKIQIEEGRKRKSKTRYIKSCLQIFNDKTLWFASIYFIVISLSFIQIGFVSLLMIDFFIRFKISKKVTQIITKPIITLILIVSFSVQIAYLYTLYRFGIDRDVPCPNTGTCIQNSYIQYLGLNKNLDIQSQFLQIKARQIAQFYFLFFNIMMNTSLIISVLIYEKKAKNEKQSDWQFKVKKKCFICDIQRSTIDRNRNNNKGFFEHIEEEHNLWNYVFYLIYLKNKQSQLLDSMETFVMEQWNKGQIDWIPNDYKKQI